MKPTRTIPLGAGSVLAALHTGDLPLPAGSRAYVLFPAAQASTMAAAELLA